MKRKLFLLLITGFCISIHLAGQQERACININNVNGITTLRTTHDFVTKSAIRSRTFDHNVRLRQLTPANKGDTLLLDFFDNRTYKAVISNVTIGYDDVLGITARIVDHDFASCFISLSKARISIRADLPIYDEHYRVIHINGQPVLSQYTLSEVNKNNHTSEEMDILPPIDSAIQTELSQLHAAVEEITEHVTIDVLVAYSTKAKEWAERNATSIDNAIDMAFQYANHVLDNSNIRITFNIIYKYETDYAESPDANMDLATLQKNDDGILDEVHILRKQYGADLVVLMPMTGSYAYLPNYDLNKPDPSFGFSVCNVVGSTFSTTLIHELGHNLGAHHHWQQLRTRYPGPGIFSYSSAWRDVGEDGQWYFTVMSYDGNSFADKNPSILIPYFSNPDIIVNGVPIGSEEKENNALTLEQTKHVIAHYSELLENSIPYTVNSNGVLTHYNGSGGNVLIPSNLDITSIGASAFRANASLLSVSIPSRIYSIGNQAFEHCTALTDITLPETTNSIGTSAFNGCSSLKHLTVDAYTPPQIAASAFSGVNTATCKLLVPYGRKSAYRDTPVWNEFVEIEEREFATGCESINNSTLSAYAANGSLHVFGLNPGESLRIYTLTGQLIYNGIANTSEAHIPLSSGGFNIVIAGEKRLKVRN